MNKPGWVNVIGILFVIVGIYGVGVGAFSIKMMPQISNVMDAQKDVLKTTTNDLNETIEFTADEQTTVTVKTENPSVDVRDGVVTIKSNDATTHAEVDVKVGGPLSEESASAINNMKSVAVEEMSNTIDSFNFEEDMVIWVYASIFVSSVFLLAGILLLSMHKYALIACYSALGVSLLFNLVPTFFNYELSIISLILDVIFFIVIITGEKKALTPTPIHA